MAVKRGVARAETRRLRNVPEHTSRLPWVATLGLLVLTAAIAYGPALKGPFLFDDFYLPMNAPQVSSELRDWVRWIRPLLTFTYWVNYRTAGLDPAPYHVFNLFLHLANGLLVFAIARKLLQLSGGGRAMNWLASFAAGLFLLHPVQTESVSYIAGRSESLSVFFLYGGFAVFLYFSGRGISWKAVAAVLALFAAAVASKEHAVALLGLLLLTDYYFNPGFSFDGIRRNWRLYVPGLIGAAASAALVLTKVLAGASTAGFGIKEFTWYQYFFTQCRAFFHYLRLFVLPVGLTADYDFPISRTVFDHGAALGLAALGVLIWIAWRYRKRYPLASYGFFAVVVLLAPTSSFVPIKDPVAERRMYLPMIGYLAVVLEAARRARVDRKVAALLLGGALMAAATATYARNRTYVSAIQFWEDAVSKAPGKARAHFQLAFAYYSDGRCEDALRQYRKVSELEPPGYDLLANWALAYDCLGQPGPALEKLREAAILDPTAHAYSSIGMILAKQARWEEALSALNTAEQRDPSYAMTYVYRGNIYLATKQPSAAAPQFQRALSIDPGNQLARDGLAIATAGIRSAPGPP